MKLFKLFIALGLPAIFYCGNSAFAEAPIVIKFNHVVSVNTPKGQAANRFKQLAEERTHGRVRVEVYANGQLYQDKDEMAALQEGSIQMIVPILAKFAPLGIKEFEVFDLPYLFPNKAALTRITEGKIGQQILAKLNGQGMTGLAFWDNGFKVFSANTPLRKPADFRGLKMRIQPSQVIAAQMRALGAIPKVMSFAATHQALKEGVVDGTENPPLNFYTQRMYEAQKYVTLSNHGYLGYLVIVNKPFWDGLPSDIRSILADAMKDATRYANAIADQTNDAALNAVRAAGTTKIYTPTAAETAAMRAAMAPVYKAVEGRVGKSLIRAIRREVAQVMGRK